MKKFLALLMALTLSLSMAAPAFAAGVAEDADVSAGVVVYEDENIVVYDTRRTYYGNAWFNSSSTLQNKNISVHSEASGRIGITLGIESSSKSAHAYASIYEPSGRMLFLTNAMTGSTVCELGNIDGTWIHEQKFIFADMPAGNYRINFHNVYAPEGTRLMCWIYNV